VREHFERTGSLRAREVLDVWDYYRELFWKVSPRGRAEDSRTGHTVGPRAAELAAPVSRA
jgi:glutamate synthase domain-containing protein 3